MRKQLAPAKQGICKPEGRSPKRWRSVELQSRVAVAVESFCSHALENLMVLSIWRALLSCLRFRSAAN